MRISTGSALSLNRTEQNNIFNKINIIYFSDCLFGFVNVKMNNRTHLPFLLCNILSHDMAKIKRIGKIN